MHIVETINTVLMILFFIFYSYQFIYVPIALLYRHKKHKPEVLHRIAVLIAARNEQAVIGNLIDSIRAQSYPAEYVDIYVGADNCTDETARVAREHGATVFERFDKVRVGKGYVLNFLLEKISGIPHDAYLVLDADNVLDPNFIREINAVHTDGYEIVTCYRNSKNYGDNWITAGYALWFLREARYLNEARYAIGSSCAVSGTGFLFSEKIREECGGWNFFLLTEDIEFTIHNVVHGRKVGYARNAVLYDEQPVTFRQSWRQRMRWSKGYLQVCRKYGCKLIAGIFRGSFSCYDMAMNIMPAAVLSAVSVVVNLIGFGYSFSAAGDTLSIVLSVLKLLEGLYLTLFILGGITTVTEWKQIHCAAWKKVLYVFTFPLFMLTYIPICLCALFSKVEWKPITHEKSMTLAQIKESADR